MADDDSFRGTSPPVGSPGLGYEQSQAHQEIRLKREAELSPEELAEQEERDRATRRKWRRYHGNDRSSSPVKEESLSPTPRRTTAALGARVIGGYYEPFGPLDSQTGDGTYVEHLLGAWEESASQEIDSWEESASQEESDEAQEPAANGGSDRELPELQRVEHELNTTLRERDQARDYCRRYRTVSRAAAARCAKLQEELDRWIGAAEGASALAQMLQPHIT
ncbi:hypothetical protein DFH06DRAFT_1468474 [Mycena polygramma]|nr:hypothetical protein DFH06DRAFT_1468474 [Mycena polygramma]